MPTADEWLGRYQRLARATGVAVRLEPLPADKPLILGWSSAWSP
jgi:hypothetical protein